MPAGSSTIFFRAESKVVEDSGETICQNHFPGMNRRWEWPSPPLAACPGYIWSQLYAGVVGSAENVVSW